MRLTGHGARIIAVFLLGGLAMAAAGVALLGAPSDAAGVVLIVVGGTWVAGALVAIGIAIAAEVRVRRREPLARTGIRGRATIVEIIGVALPPLEVVLDVDVPGYGTRRIERKLMMEPYVARRMRPGTVLPVYANPDDPDDLLFVI